MIKEIYKSKKYHLAINIAGGGSSVIGKLLSVPGASNVMIQANVAYSQAAIDQAIGGVTPKRYTSFEVARALAWSAYESAWTWGQMDEAHRFSSPGNNALGFGCTACLKPNGKGSAFVAIETAGPVFTLRWSQGELMPPSTRIEERDSLCLGRPALLTLPYRDIVGSRAKQEEAMAYNILLILHEFSR